MVDDPEQRVHQPRHQPELGVSRSPTLPLHLTLLAGSVPLERAPALAPIPALSLRLPPTNIVIVIVIIIIIIIIIIISVVTINLARSVMNHSSVVHFRIEQV